MITNKGIVVLIVAVLCLVSLMAPLSSSQEVQGPEWKLGQTWAMGYEEDLGGLSQPIQDMVNLLVAMDPDLEKADISLSGELGFYQIYRVTEVTDDEYVMSISAGGGVHVDAKVSITGMMDKPGTYEWGDDIPTERRTMSVDLKFHLTVAIEGEIRFERDTLAIKGVELENSINLKIEVEGENLPDHDWDWDSQTETISYMNIDAWVKGELELSLDIRFEPALDIFNFPMEVGEEWDVESTMTISGTYSGQIDAGGLPDELIEEMEEEGLSFPITPDDLDIPGFSNGIIHPYQIPIHFTVSCTGTESIKLEDGSTDTVYLLEMEPDLDWMMDDWFGLYDTSVASLTSWDGGEWYEDEWDFDMPSMSSVMKYSPDRGFIVSQEMKMSDMDMMDIIPPMEMAPMTESDASRKMSSMQEMPSDESLLDALQPYLFIIGIVIGVLLVVVIISMKRKGKKPTTDEPYNTQPQWEQPPTLSDWEPQPPPR